MRRTILVGMSVLALFAAMAIGPFGAAGAAPYVYGCTPASFVDADPQPAAYFVSLSVYNGTATTANLTLKVLGGNGTIRTTGSGLPPLTSTLSPTHAVFYRWNPLGVDPQETNLIDATVRIVSSVPIAATLMHKATLTNGVWVPIICMPMQP